MSEVKRASSPSGDGPKDKTVLLHTVGNSSMVSGYTLAGAEGLLTWFAAHMGTAFVAAAMIVPITFIGRILAEFKLARHLRRAPTRKYAVVGIGIAIASVYAILAIVIPSVSGIAGISILLVAALVFGATTGLFDVANAELRKLTLSHENLTKTLYVSAAASGVISLLLLLAMHLILPFGQQSHNLLLWLAVGTWLGTVIALGRLQEPATVPQKADKKAKRLGLRETFRVRWFRENCFATLMFLGVEISIPFYVIHASTIHAPTLKNAMTVVAAIGVGYLVGGPLWALFPKSRPWLVSLVASFLAAIGALAILIADEYAFGQILYVHFAALVLVSVARIGSKRVRKIVSLRTVPPENSTSLIGTLAGFESVFSIAAALVLGTAAELQDITVVLLILLATNIAAGIYALTYWRTRYNASEVTVARS